MPVNDRTRTVLAALAESERSVPALLSESIGWGSDASVRTTLERLEASGYVRHVTPEEGGPSAGRTLWAITEDGKSEVA